MRYSIERQFGSGLRGIEFFVYDTNVQRDYIQDQLDTLATALDEGVEFSESKGELRIGWMLNDLVKTETDYLRIEEPDFIHMPIRSIPSLDRTFLHFASQFRVADKLGLADRFDLPTIAHACLICSRYDKDDTYVMERVEPAGPRDSGWYIGCVGSTHDHNDPKNLRQVSLYEACLHRPTIADYVGLPVETQIIVSSQGLDAATYKGIRI